MQKSYGRLEQNKNKEIVTKNDRPASGAGFERAVLVAVIRDQQDPRQAEEYLAELEFLAETAGIVGVRRFTQRLPQPSARIYVGPGKLEEIAAYCKEEEIDVAIFDDELSPSQTRNIEAAMPCRILDRTRLILDIFMSRAQTAYAKTQVQLANYQYMLPRLSGMWTHLERQRGGTGTRGGAGEREIETDRRIIRNRISKLKEDLQKIDRQMAVQRSNRGSMVRVALVGYTNVGKSTLMNLISKSEVFAENKLFATLDTTVRKVVFDNLPFLLSDTVGFIRKLPTELIESFKSTLDEVREADLLLHVVDISHPQFEDQIAVVKQTLQDIGAGDKPVYLVFNKVDAYTYVEKEPDDLTPSTRENRSLEDLKQSWIARPIRPASLFRQSRRSISRSCVRICTAWSVKSIRAAIHSTTSSIDLKQKLNKYNLMLHILNSQNTILNKFVAEIRDKSIQKDSMRFRRNLERIGEVMAYEISKTFEYAVKVVETPLGEASVAMISDQVVIATILRAGLPFHQGFLNYFDDAQNAFVSAYRKSTKDGKFTVKVEYISCGELEGKTLLLVDPMLATGSSLVLAYNALCERGGQPAHTHVAAVIASEQGVEYVEKNMPKRTTTIWCAAVDEELTSRAYIVPGIGDAGDLAYGEKI